MHQQRTFKSVYEETTLIFLLDKSSVMLFLQTCDNQLTYANKVFSSWCKVASREVMQCHISIDKTWGCAKQNISQHQHGSKFHHWKMPPIYDEVAAKYCFYYAYCETPVSCKKQPS